MDGEADEQRGEDQPQVAGVDHREHRPAPEHDAHGSEDEQLRPPHAIGQVREVRQEEQRRDATGQDHPEQRALGQVQGPDAVVEDPGHHDEGDGVRQDERAAREQDRPPVLAQHLHQRRLLGGGRLRAGRLQLLELGRVLHRAVDVEPDADHDQTGQERNPPAPRHHLLVREEEREHEERADPAHQPQLRADLHEAPEEAAPAGRARSR
ncbi:hypothetical protein LUX57_50725 [Actinomadura madurae]|nr:hypothetical protein [Actinomadura madurae]MCP9972350.1 hypothetical protein [Actinomadura madurae]